MIDGLINIATGLSASSKIWRNKAVKWSSLVDKLMRETKTTETYSQFMSASKADQSRAKDLGGFVGGFLANGNRSKKSVLYRQVVTLDADFSYADFWWDFTNLFDCAAVIHSTHKSCPEKPRHRLILPLSREVTPEEYQAISRKIAGDLNINIFDPTTFEPERLMFWPSVSSDMDLYTEVQDGPWLDADSILKTYTDWHDMSEWPINEGHDKVIRNDIQKQEDPEEKKGVVGTFCRAYNINEAIEKFLPDVYEEAGPERYTYLKGSTAAGLITYDDKFAYSHHSTDPAGNQLCNAFDLVRIHKFGHLDTGNEKNEQGRRSYKAMEEFATKDPATKKKIASERLAEARFDFAEGIEDVEVTEEDTTWMEQLDANTKGEYENTANNIGLIIANDKRLKDAFMLNSFDCKRYVLKSLPWRKIDSPETLRDVDLAGMRNYIECIYGIVSSSKIDDSWALEFEKKSVHPIKEYLSGLEWDGVARINTLLVDYFGAEDNAYTRAAIRKPLCGAVARIFNPGTKFDLVLTLIGDQGTYKSTFVKKLGRQWFSDTFITVQGTQAFEQLRGAWIIEIAELSGLKKAEVETTKQFISKCEDMYRPAYGHITETFKRQCVFFGTTNNKDFLRDPTGNRRFMPIDVRNESIKKSVVEDMTPEEVDQIWAEAVQMYKAGERLYLTGEEEIIARKEQHMHAESDERKGLIEHYLDTLLPEDWDSLDLIERQLFLDDPIAKLGSVERTRVCVPEIWCECLGKDKTDMSRYNTRDINEILKSLGDWESVMSTKNFPLYGKQKYYIRKDSLL